MKVEYVNPFFLSTLSTFKTMLECALARGTPYVKNGSNDLEVNDRDNQVPKPIPPLNNHSKKALPGLGVIRAQKKFPGGP